VTPHFFLAARSTFLLHRLTEICLHRSKQKGTSQNTIRQISLSFCLAISELFARSTFATCLIFSAFDLTASRILIFASLILVMCSDE
jgi:hypothetical protein